MATAKPAPQVAGRRCANCGGAVAFQPGKNARLDNRLRRRTSLRLGRRPEFEATNRQIALEIDELALILKGERVAWGLRRPQMRHKKLLECDAHQGIHEQRHEHERHDRAAIAQDLAQLFDRQPSQASQPVVRTGDIDIGHDGGTGDGVMRVCRL